MAKACASHGSRNTGPFGVAGNAGHRLRSRALRRRDRWRSGRLEIRLERVDRDLDRRVGVRAPQLAARRTPPCRAIADSRVPSIEARVRKHVAAVIAARPRRHGRARSAAGACASPGWMFLARTRSPGLNFGSVLVRPAELAAVKHALDIRHAERPALERLAGPQRVAGLHLVGVDEAALDQHVCAARGTISGSRTPRDRQCGGSVSRECATCRCCRRRPRPWRASSPARGLPTARETAARSARPRPCRSRPCRPCRARRS